MNDKRNWTTPKLTELDELADGTVIPAMWSGAGNAKTHFRATEFEDGRVGTNSPVGPGQMMYEFGGPS